MRGIIKSFFIGRASPACQMAGRSPLRVGVGLPTLFLIGLAFIFIISHSPAAYAYGFLVSGEGKYLRWSADDIPLDYTISNWWLPDAVEPVGAVYAGFKTWENVTGASISFNYNGTTTDTLSAEQDNVNMIGWTAEGWIAGIEVPGTFGVTYYGWYDTNTLLFDEVDIALNLYWPWSTTGETNVCDIQGVVTHEVGHMLGLAHTDWEVEQGTMTWAQFKAKYSDRCEATMMSGPNFLSEHTVSQTALLRTLEADDIAGISVLYPPGYASTGEGGGAGGGCFIATACYGSPLAREVRVLSMFRDRYLVKNSLGRVLVSGYNRVGPALAEIISEKPLLRFMVRAQLKPWVKIAGLINQTPTD